MRWRSFYLPYLSVLLACCASPPSLEVAESKAGTDDFSDLPLVLLPLTSEGEEPFVTLHNAVGFSFEVHRGFFGGISHYILRARALESPLEADQETELDVLLDAYAAAVGLGAPSSQGGLLSAIATAASSAPSAELSFLATYQEIQRAHRYALESADTSLLLSAAGSGYKVRFDQREALEEEVTLLVVFARILEVVAFHITQVSEMGTDISEINQRTVASVPCENLLLAIAISERIDAGLREPVQGHYDLLHGKMPAGLQRDREIVEKAAASAFGEGGHCADILSDEQQDEVAGWLADEAGALLGDVLRSLLFGG